MTMSLFAELDDSPVVEDIKASEEVTLRPYQLECRKSVHEHWAMGNRVTLACLATGLGKSVIFTAIMEDVCRG